MRTLGLVTVLFNSPEVLPEFFESLAAQTDKDWHLEVIDNSTDDRSMTAARECAARLGLGNVRFTKNADNVGVAKANNQGITNCLELGCDYIVLLNNDIVFGPNLLRDVRKALDAGESLVAPRVHYFDDNSLWYAGGRIRPIAATAEHYRDRKQAAGPDHQQRYTGYAPTCFMGMRAEVFERVGLMDDRYFVYYDDTDFVYRCLKQGYRLLYLGSAELKHKVSSSTGGESSDFSIYYYNRNRLFFIRKNYAGLEQLVAFGWYYLTRLYKMGVYGAKQRTVLARAMRDGRSMG
jgi:GT2 family glycosyltransferase